MLIKSKGPYQEGMNVISQPGMQDGAEMFFGVYILKAGKQERFNTGQETAFVLIKGEVDFIFCGKTVRAQRGSCFHDDPWVLHVPKGTEAVISGIAGESEIAVLSSENDRDFEAAVLTPEMCGSENRGAGTMRETATRVVRNILNVDKRDYSNFFMGEVVNFPGKWSSYPSHEHDQPELYYYKFYPEDGFGFSEDGAEAHKTHNNDTGLYTNRSRHCQASAPGYALYYLWIVHHSPGNPHLGPDTAEDLKWVAEPEAKYYPEI